MTNLPACNRGNFGFCFTWWDRWCGTDAEYLRHGDTRFGAPKVPEASA